ncbi:MAG TPA: hypothetical protein VJ203_00980 [Bacteroidales bacterium]|nr:hypothetical protein [Bacteroidales bacterium]
MIKKIFLSLVILSLLSAIACRNKADRKTSPDSGFGSDSVYGTVIADTITYDVIIRNPDPGDTWRARCLSRLNHKALIDSIFDLVYTGRALAFNLETWEKLTPRQIKDIEEEQGFSRDNIGMIQFTEAWYLDPVNNTMTKEVLSMVLGSDFYNAGGELFGHKPVFRVELK